jgi:hypothetical protein
MTERAIVLHRHPCGCRVLAVEDETEPVELELCDEHAPVLRIHRNTPDAEAGDGALRVESRTALVRLEVVRA